LELSDSTMDKALEKHTSVYAFFCAILSYAKRILDEVEVEYEYTEARVKEDRREDQLLKGKKVTEGSLHSYAKMSPKIKELQLEILEAQHKYNLAKNIVASLDHQKDMLVQMSANKRAEINLISR